MAMFLTHAKLRGIFTCIRYFIHSSFSCFFLDKAPFWPDGIELFACFFCRSFHVGRSTWRSWSHKYVTSYPFYMDAWIFVTSVTITNYVFAGGVVKWWGPGFQPWLGNFFCVLFYGYFLLEVLKQLVTSRDETWNSFSSNGPRGSIFFIFCFFTWIVKCYPVSFSTCFLCKILG